MKFGIWIEPEMVNEDSDLYRAHPDWAIRIPGKKPVRSRNQLLLDFSRKEVRDCVFDQICAVLDQGKVDYVKWDMNRSMADVYAGNLSYDMCLVSMISWSVCAAVSGSSAGGMQRWRRQV